MSPKSSRSTINWKIAALFIGVAIALPVYQEYYMRKHRPLIAAGLAADLGTRWTRTARA